jgi:hypothetical protein
MLRTWREWKRNDVKQPGRLRGPALEGGLLAGLDDDGAETMKSNKTS